MRFRCLHQLWILVNDWVGAEHSPLLVCQLSNSWVSLAEYLEEEWKVKLNFVKNLAYIWRVSNANAPVYLCAVGAAVRCRVVVVSLLPLPPKSFNSNWNWN